MVTDCNVAVNELGSLLRRVWAECIVSWRIRSDKDSWSRSVLRRGRDVASRRHRWLTVQQVNVSRFLSSTSTSRSTRSTPSTNDDDLQCTTLLNLWSYCWICCSHFHLHCCTNEQQSDITDESTWARQLSVTQLCYLVLRLRGSPCAWEVPYVSLHIIEVQYVAHQ